MVIVAVLQAYILRLRHMICSWVYPSRARERAIHLYNVILQLRGSFSTYVRRQIQRNTDEQANVEKVCMLFVIFLSDPQNPKVVHVGVLIIETRLVNMKIIGLL